MGRITQQVQNQQEKTVYKYSFVNYTATELKSDIYKYTSKESEELTQ